MRFFLKTSKLSGAKPPPPADFGRRVDFWPPPRHDLKWRFTQIDIKEAHSSGRSNPSRTAARSSPCAAAPGITRRPLGRGSLHSGDQLRTAGVGPSGLENRSSGRRQWADPGERRNIGGQDGQDPSAFPSTEPTGRPSPAIGTYQAPPANSPAGPAFCLEPDEKHGAQAEIGA